MSLRGRTSHSTIWYVICTRFNDTFHLALQPTSTPAFPLQPWTPLLVLNVPWLSNPHLSLSPETQHLAQNP